MYAKIFIIVNFVTGSGDFMQLCLIMLIGIQLSIAASLFT